MIAFTLFRHLGQFTHYHYNNSITYHEEGLNLHDLDVSLAYTLRPNGAHR